MTRQEEIQREVGTKAGRALAAGSSYLPEGDYGITKRMRINPHASAWEIPEGYEDKVMDVCALKNEVLPLCCIK